MGSSVGDKILKNGLSSGHYFGLKSYKLRKFGAGHTAWLAYKQWVSETFKIDREIEDYTDAQGKAVIEAMKLLHDAPPEGQGVLL